jgi:hypothetical protein
MKRTHSRGSRGRYSVPAWGGWPEQERPISDRPNVAFMLHEIAASSCKSLKQNENACNMMQHENDRAKELSP